MPSPRRLSQLDSEVVLGCNYLSVVFVPRCLELLCNVRAVYSCVLVSYANAGACVSALVMCMYIYMYYTTLCSHIAVMGVLMPIEFINKHQKILQAFGLI